MSSNHPEEVLCFSKRKNPDWFNKLAEEILPLLVSKNSAFQAHLAHPTSAMLLQKWKKSCSIVDSEICRTIGGPAKHEKFNAMLMKSLNVWAQCVLHPQKSAKHSLCCPCCLFGLQQTHPYDPLWGLEEGSCLLGGPKKKMERYAHEVPQDLLHSTQ